MNRFGDVQKELKAVFPLRNRNCRQRGQVRIVLVGTLRGQTVQRPAFGSQLRRLSPALIRHNGHDRQNREHKPGTGEPERPACFGVLFGSILLHARDFEEQSAFFKLSAPETSRR